MSDILKPRVMVTATVADRFPADLHLFRNYESPADILESGFVIKLIMIKDL